MKTKILFIIIIATLALSITAVSLSLQGWIAMNLIPNTILNKRIVLNSVAVSLASILLIMTLFRHKIRMTIL